MNALLQAEQQTACRVLAESLPIKKRSADRNQMQYTKCSPYSPLEDKWGDLTRFVEVAADGYAARQVDHFAGGTLLRYSRDQWCDDFGALSPQHVSAINSHLLTEITAAEFEAVWMQAAAAPNQPQHYHSPGSSRRADDQESQDAALGDVDRVEGIRVRAIAPWLRHLTEVNFEDGTSR